jgi:hypothetical protein
MDKENMTKHIEEHIIYPTTKIEMLKACNNMSEITEDDKDWFYKTLPEGKYSSADEVLKALGM